MENPKNLKYTKEHEWVKLDGAIGTVGITDHAQHLLTDIVFVDLPEKGKKTEQSKAFAAVESVKSVSDVFAPVSGEVVESNSALKDKPELINQDAFGKGWIAKIKVSNKAELDKLMSADQYTNFVKEEKH